MSDARPPYAASFYIIQPDPAFRSSKPPYDSNGPDAAMGQTPIDIIEPTSRKCNIKSPRIHSGNFQILPQALLTIDELGLYWK
ncbi:MAG: hypothetical protein HPY71_08660 [Firmicutes bacterium]|nr:hypothetical protein [Bacillota bacterium]